MSSARLGSAPAAILLGFASLTLVLAGCSGQDASDFEPGCSVTVQYSPPVAQPSPTQPIRASALVRDYQGIARYHWRVLHAEAEVPFDAADSDLSMIEFLAAAPGVYRVELRVETASACPMYSNDLNVLPSGAVQRQYRLRITPPPGFGGSGPQDQLVDLFDGVDYAVPSRTLFVGEESAREVRSDGAPVAAYLRFSPHDGEGLFSEVSSAADGGATPRLGPEDYSVLVVPTGAFAPYKLERWSPNTAILDGPAGTLTTGEVRDPDNAPIAGARVSVKMDGLPATVGISAADGTFSMRVGAGTGLELSVVPPPGLGLPRLVGSAQIVPGQPLAIRYQGFARRDVAGVQLQRQGGAAPSARVTFVGPLASAGRLNGGVELRGEVRIAVTAGADGRLPATALPQAELVAVVEPAAGELAVLPFSTLAAPPAALDAPAMRPVTGSVRDHAAAALPGATLELIPQGPLALAGAPALSATAGAAGAFSIPSAPGGSYRVALADPAQRGTLRIIDVPPSGALGAVALGRGWKVTSKLTSLFGPPVRATSVELYCVDCPAVAKVRPISTAVTDEAGAFSLLVPDAVP